MDAADLKVFEAVARLGGTNRAAAGLNTVQSNVTARVRQLEEELGTPLFERHSRGVSLTPAGHRLLPYAARVGRLLDDARRAAKDDGKPAGPLVVGSLETTAALRLSPLLTAFAAAHPAVDLSLRTGTTCELVDHVLQNRVEGAFVCGPVSHPELESRVAFREELVVLTAPSVPSLGALVGRGDLRIVVLRAGCSYRQRLEELLARRGIVDPRRLEFGTLEAIFGCVAAGLGVTLLPRALLGPVWRDGRVAAHELPPEEAEVETVFIRRRDAHLSSALAAFLGLSQTAQPFARAAE
ncbi:MAG: LysR family transcriptional regulator [Acetobacteraceae bacterium]|nr:LysR family transcriptional regulator [Acetobacteraceae bacterium]